MLKKLPVVFVLLLSQNISAGQKILDSAFSKCRNITNAVLRLDCYDQLASANDFIPIDRSKPTLRETKQTKWEPACSVKSLSATESRSGREETLIRCEIPLIPTGSQYSVSHIVVEPNLVYFRQYMSDSRACGYGPKVSVDGVRVPNEKELVQSKEPALGSTKIIPYILKGSTADIQKQALWPDCRLETHTVSLSGLQEVLDDAERWVRERESMGQ